MSQSSEKGGTPVGNVPHTFDRRGAWVASPLDSLTLICVGENPICSLVFDADGNPLWHNTAGRADAAEVRRPWLYSCADNTLFIADGCGMSGEHSAPLLRSWRRGG